MSTIMIYPSVLGIELQVLHLMDKGKSNAVLNCFLAPPTVFSSFERKAHCVNNTRTLHCHYIPFLMLQLQMSGSPFLMKQCYINCDNVYERRYSLIIKSLNSWKLGKILSVEAWINLHFRIRHYSDESVPT